LENYQDLTWTARKRNRFVLSALARRFGEERVGSASLSVLDVGCGGGTLSEALGQAGIHGLLGIDLDPQAIAEARKRCSRFGHRFERRAIEDFDSAPVFDAVVLSEVLICLHDPLAALQAARRWLQPGGLVVLTAANGYGPWALYRRLVERRTGIERGPRSALGLHSFTARGLLRLAREAGFQVEGWAHSNFLSAVYPFSVSRYRQASFGFIERWDLKVADCLPRSLASGWYLSLLPSGAQPQRSRRRERDLVTAASA
jgi:2-polyprenyl-3-methyl-5-hydroxy-6-metoxy-1,4-benzoquinol methylase